MDRLRTFGIVAHIDAGKTTLTERILLDTGAQSYAGNVDDGTAAMDWMPQERSRGISITAAATRATWGGHLLQIVDTPGHVDFVAEVERCLHVLDGVVVVVDSVRGVESQTEAVWQQADARALPRLVFVNKLDRVGADFAAVVAELREHFDCAAVPFVVPLADGDGVFAGLGCAITGAVQWFTGRPAAELATRLQAEVVAAHERLLEAAADHDDGLLADLVAGRRVPADRLRAVLRVAVRQRRVVPVLCGAALWNRGVDWLLDAVVAFLPSPADLERAGLWSVEQAGDPSAPFCGLVFKVQHADEVWNYVRVVRGRLLAGRRYAVSRAAANGCDVAEIWAMQADRHTAVAGAEPGEIVVLPGDLSLRTGDTLHDPEAAVVLMTPRFPAPVLAVTFEPKRSENGPRMLKALRELAIDDPTLRVDHDGAQVTVRGMGELHLDVVAELLQARIGREFRLSRPRVDRRETVRGPGTGDVEIRAVVGDVECAARCRVTVEPLADPALAAVVTAWPGVPSALAEIAQRELRARLATGLQAGPMSGVRVSVEEVVGDGAPLEALVEQAASKALAAAAERAGLQLLEPWVELDIWSPEVSCAAVMADLGARGAVVTGVSSGRLGARVQGRAPLAHMLGYVTRLRSITKGRGQASLRPSGFLAILPR